MVWGYAPSVPWFWGGSWGDPGQGQVSTGDYVDRHDGEVVGIGDDKWRGTYKYTQEGSAAGSHVPISGYQSVRGMPAGTINAVPITKKPFYSRVKKYIPPTRSVANAAIGAGNAYLGYKAYNKGYGLGSYLPYVSRGFDRFNRSYDQYNYKPRFPVGKGGGKFFLLQKKRKRKRKFYK